MWLLALCRRKLGIGSGGKTHSPRVNRGWKGDRGFMKRPQRAGKTQETQPKRGKPIEIPVPEREEIEGMLKRAAKGSTTRRASK
jgi:hypothetical protein